MKTKNILLTIILVTFSLTAWGQQLGDGRAPGIDNYNTTIPSGFYATSVKQNGFPEFNASPYADNLTYLINLSRNEGAHQWQIATPWGGDDRIFFRKMYPITGAFDTPWHELATRGENVFTDNQYMSSVGKLGLTPMGQYSPKLYFGAQFDNSDEMFIARYNVADNYSDLRVFIGDDNQGEDAFRVGNMISSSGNWRSFISVLNNGKVGIGVETPQNALDVNGIIRAKEIIVETGWADFVFAKDYKLPSLNEVKAHIDEHKHLPGIPSEAEVKENGVALSDVTTKMMQKIEELTLYAIQQNEKATEQQKLIEQLNKRINELENSKK